MGVKNEMETAVRTEVRRLRDGSAGPKWASWLPSGRILRGVPFLQDFLGREALYCRCPLCLTDAVALALTLLPPCYCRSDHYGLALGRVNPELIQQKVGSAVRKVELRPRHPARQPVPSQSEIRLVDFGLREGARIIQALLRKMPDACDCEKCREDTLALGLNRFRPKYGVLVEGKMRVPPHHLEFIRHELLGTLVEAAKAIATNPRHGGRDGI